jgi:Polyketide cyclase / dehydrase and lipid transport
MALRGTGATVTALAPASPAQTFAIMTPVDPSRFYPRFRVIPATVEVRDQTGAWDGEGQTRQLVLSDGGSVIETLKSVQPPFRFVYELTDFRKVFGVLVDHARAEWLFGEEEQRTRVRWTYTFFAKPGRGLLVAAIVKAFWGPYMRHVLPGLVAEVRRAAR